MADRARTRGAGNRDTRVGYIAVLGRTNVGKSTFLNSMVGRKVLITSPKPQTTRNRIRCVLTSEDAQIVFVDTPGLHQQQDPLSRRLLQEARRSLRGIDVLVYIVEPWGDVTELDQRVFEEWKDLEIPRILLVNKVDAAKRNQLEETLLAYAATDLFDELIPISALTREGIDDVHQTLLRYLRSGPFLFPPEEDTDQSEAFLIGELIREKVFRLTHQEVPYSTAVRLKNFEERDDGLIEIKAEIIVERESQKGILIGKGGRMVKKLGSFARQDIERLLGAQVFLEIVIAVRPNWARNEEQIDQLTQRM